MDRKIVLVRRRTRLEELIARFNSESQARFYVEHLGSDFEDYRTEHREYQEAFSLSVATAARVCRIQILDRSFLPNFLFAPTDVVVAVGQDGMVANILKYLSGQPLVGVNPSPSRWDGILAPFSAKQMDRVLKEVVLERSSIREISMAMATLGDGQSLLAVNDLFVGQKSHVSARYELQVDGVVERQSSSGIVVSTGLGSTGWMRSIVEEAKAITGTSTDLDSIESVLPWEAQTLRFAVREAFPSKATGNSLVYGTIDPSTSFEIVSQMPDNGVVFSDGIESDFLEFNAGSRLKIGLSPHKGRLVVH